MSKVIKFRKKSTAKIPRFDPGTDSFAKIEIFDAGRFTPRIIFKLALKSTAPDLEIIMPAVRKFQKDLQTPKTKRLRRAA